MGAVAWTAFVIALVALVAWYLSYTAARLDRLHTKVEGSVSALDAQLVRRAEVVREVAGSGALDPASSALLADAASASLDAADSTSPGEELRADGIGDQRAAVESTLTQVICTTLTPDVIAELRDENSGWPDVVERLRSAGQRVEIARRFHNDAVRDVRRLRHRPPVRFLRLAGHTALPSVIEFDDRLPDGL
ncbi:hypothetical protein [Flexivirga caeni]|uniref:LemA family protein n=1 Tax=Flexivirga caeni TaxID=2294115 RepID=A0A3M9MBE2_9MICO|nr:hypothetical protein [Flexivirga caeni]RNI22879.1 hypothetical protein EFY87_08715 [Flexivirga caeni]